MSPAELRKAMQVIDELGEHAVDLRSQDVITALQSAGVQEPVHVLQELLDAGLIQAEGDVIRKIAKHMFW